MATQLRGSPFAAHPPNEIEAVRLCYRNRSKNLILAKAAFPSEIYSHVRVLNPGKVEGKQPDVIINLPDKKHFIIDSKLSLVAYKRYFSTPNEDET